MNGTNLRATRVFRVGASQWPGVFDGTLAETEIGPEWAPKRADSGVFGATGRVSRGSWWELRTVAPGEAPLRRGAGLGLATEAAAHSHEGHGGVGKAGEVARPPAGANARATLVTRNVSDFSDIPGLAVLDAR